MNEDLEDREGQNSERTECKGSFVQDRSAGGGHVRILNVILIARSAKKTDKQGPC